MLPESNERPNPIAKPDHCDEVASQDGVGARLHQLLTLSVADFDEGISTYRPVMALACRAARTALSAEERGQVSHLRGGSGPLDSNGAPARWASREELFRILGSIVIATTRPLPQRNAAAIALVASLAINRLVDGFGSPPAPDAEARVAIDCADIDARVRAIGLGVLRGACRLDVRSEHNALTNALSDVLDGSMPTSTVKNVAESSTIGDVVPSADLKSLVLDTKQVAAFLVVDPRTIQTWRRARKSDPFPKPKKRGKKNVFELFAVIEWAKGQHPPQDFDPARLPAAITKTITEARERREDAAGEEPDAYRRLGQRHADAGNNDRDGP